MIKQEYIQGYKVEYYKGTGEKKYKAIVYKGKEKIGTYQFGQLGYNNGFNAIEPGKYEWKTKRENEEHRRRYKQRHQGDNLTFPSSAWFSFYRLW